MQLNSCANTKEERWAKFYLAKILCYTVDSSLSASVLIRVIATILVLKSERVLINESIEATSTNHAICAHIHARGLAQR